ncbi:DinB/UmuC family translesion DNA polymerase [Grimontia sp. NTOU-MAR1]|uniref:DinB/UmuC family translesion DNA polymerase n=1 Tax=Grimontia sp. NTOU-MAR1 TaxID=3111011 RepID=UPI002DB8ECB2|nr:hypothetical protein [Grimontia sp. NTOU-MAR1]WRW00575.1 hypothetical protein VP504_19160 [Grimontia sp. NTOU-MAR1]
MMMLFACSSSYDKTDAGSAFRYVHRFNFPCDDTLVMTQIASEVAQREFKYGVKYYKIGVGLLDLSSQEYAQLDMFTFMPFSDQRNVFGLSNLSTWTFQLIQSCLMTKYCIGLFSGRRQFL